MLMANCLWYTMQTLVCSANLDILEPVSTRSYIYLAIFFIYCCNIESY